MKRDRFDPSMTHSFSFGFGNDDIEESVDDTVDQPVDVKPFNETPIDRPIAAMDPKLHNLQDLV